MKIEFTKEQYRTLLLLTYLGDWVINAHELDEKDEGVKKLLQHIYARHNDFEETELVEKDEDNECYWTTRALDDLAHPHIEDYDDKTMWEELIYRLAERDFYNQNSQEHINKMSKEEFFQGIGEFENYYAKEFETNGLERIGVPA